MIVLLFWLMANGEYALEEKEFSSLDECYAVAFERTDTPDKRKEIGVDGFICQEVTPTSKAEMGTFL